MIKKTPLSPIKQGSNIAIIPICDISSKIVDTLCYAESIASDIRILYLITDDKLCGSIKEKWDQWCPGYQLTILKSDIKELIEQILVYIEKIQKDCQQDDFITILFAELELDKWKQQLLNKQYENHFHNLVLKENIVITIIPNNFSVIL